MALTRAWQEAYPDDDNFGYELDDYQRQIRNDVRERLAVQHKAYLDETGHTDVGEHKPGECTVSYIGLKSTFPVPATTTKGCIAIATDEANQQYYWTGTAWSKVQEPMLITGDQAIAGTKTFADIKASADIDIGPHNFRAQTLESDVITGTPPLVVASTTKVENLNVDNADTVDGFHAEAYAGGESHTLPGGMIIKQGVKVVTVDGDNTVTFATAFPTECTNVVATPGDATEGAYDYSLIVHTFTKTTFQIRTRLADRNSPVHWIAIGF